MENQQLIDHLFRHQYGKMVSILTRIFGLNNLETIEDAVQDTFATASLKWQRKIPENPEAWFTLSAKNRVIDLLRKIKADKNRVVEIDYGPTAISMDALFEKEAIEDSQLRMVFAACHPDLDARDQIAFALKTISGFSQNEIAAALLLKKETVKKRLSRARRAIQDNKIKFEFPKEKELPARIDRVCEVIYLIFNEGFHSSHKQVLVRKELCGEALRLTQFLLTNEQFRTGTTYALFSLMCFHSSRIEAKIDENFESIDLKNQDRSKWYRPLIELGNRSMIKSTEFEDYSIYHLEAAIALEHLKSPSFEATDWDQILQLYHQLEKLTSGLMISLSIAVIYIQLKRFEEAKRLLDNIDAQKLEQRHYLFYAVMAKYYEKTGETQKAQDFLTGAIEKVSNDVERNYLIRKREKLKVK